MLLDVQLLIENKLIQVVPDALLLQHNLGQRVIIAQGFHHLAPCLRVHSTKRLVDKWVSVLSSVRVVVSLRLRICVCHCLCVRLVLFSIAHSLASTSFTCFHHVLHTSSSHATFSVHSRKGHLEKTWAHISSHLNRCTHQQTQRDRSQHHGLFFSFVTYDHIHVLPTSLSITALTTRRQVC